MNSVEEMGRVATSLSPPAVEVAPGSGAASGVVAGAVGALPALGPALASACAGCLGAAPAAAAGAASGAGVSAFGVAAGVVTLAVVVVFHLRRARRSCPANGSGRGRVVRSVTAITAAAVLSFALMQFVIAPALTPSGSDRPAAEQLP